MFPSSAIQVVEQSATKLMIVDPPIYGGGVFFFLLGFAVLATAYWLQPKVGSKAHILGPALTIAIILSLLGFAFLTSQTCVTLSRDSGTVTIQRSSLGIRRNDRTITLTSIRNAVVEGNKYGYRIVVILKTGQPVPLGRFTGQGGHYGAANAINDFLGLPKSS